MKRLIVCFLLLIAVSSVCAAQDRPESVKIAEFDPKTENSELFVRQSKELFEKLVIAGANSRGFINLQEDDELIKKAFKELPEFSKVIPLLDLLNSTRLILRKPEKIEFWLVPQDAVPPFLELKCVGLCSCPKLEISGETHFTRDDRFLFFKATHLDTVKYKWTVAGGKIVLGQGGPHVSVKPEYDRDIRIEVQIEGIDPLCNCVNEVTFKTKFSN